MAERIRIVLTSFSRGLVTFIRPWNQPYEPPARDPRGIGRHFARVGVYISNAAERFSEEHPEIPVNA